MLLCPQPNATGEQKTKPTQNSVRELRGLGLSPDLVSLIWNSAFLLVLYIRYKILSSTANALNLNSLPICAFIIFLCQIMCRCTTPLETAVKEKISMFCHVEPTQVKYCNFSAVSLEAVSVQHTANVEWNILVQFTYLLSCGMWNLF